jgi:hypothetical protein
MSEILAVLSNMDIVLDAQTISQIIDLFDKDRNGTVEFDEFFPLSFFLKDFSYLHYLIRFVLFCFVLFCFVLFCFVLFCFVLFCFVLFVNELFCFDLLRHQYKKFKKRKSEDTTWLQQFGVQQSEEPEVAKELQQLILDREFPPIGEFAKVIGK